MKTKTNANKNKDVIEYQMKLQICWGTVTIVFCRLRIIHKLMDYGDDQFLGHLSLNNKTQKGASYHL